MIPGADLEYVRNACPHITSPVMRRPERATLRRHVPGLLLRHADGGVVVVDVKPAHRVDDAAVRAVFEWTARIVSLRGWRFEVWSGAEAILLANMTLLARYRRRL